MPFYLVFSTFQMGCKAEIKLNATADGKCLEVRQLNELHNHETNEAVFRTLFHRRRLESSYQDNVANMLSVKANNKMIQQKVMTETGKVILLKDIHNMRTKLKSSNKDMTTLQSAIEHLSKCEGAYVKLVTDENNEMRGLFFQDARMRDIFQAYPEFICIDATYKVNDLRMPLYILLIENGNGQSEIVGMWLVADETEEMMTEMITLFKEQNPSWDKVQTVMSDKDFVEREVFKKELPQAELKICLFHVLRTFRREITTERTGANKRQRENILEILQKIAYSSSLEQYERNKSLLVDTQNAQAVEYFQQNWDPIKNQWVIGLATSCSLGNKTNNRLESINQKIKQVVDKNAKFDDFAQDIVVFLNIHRTEINGKMCKVTAKVPIVSITDDSVAKDYRKELTDFAYTLVEGQLKQCEEVKIDSDDDGRYKIKDTSVRVTENKCECAFSMQYKLPCKHILKLRKMLDLNLFEKSLINERWSKHHYLGTFRSYQPEHQVTQSVYTPRGNWVQSQQQRYRAVHHVAQKLASCAAEQTGQMFDVRLRQLNELLRAWEQGDEVVIETTSRLEEQTSQDNEPVMSLSADITDDTSHVDDQISEFQFPEASQVYPRSTDENSVENENIHDAEPIISPNIDTSTDTTVTPGLIDEPTVENETRRQRETTISPDSGSSTESGELAPSGGISNAPQHVTTSENPAGTSTVSAMSGESVEVDTEANDIQISATVPLANITLTPQIRKRGRPKGSDLTVIGLPKKRLKLKRRPTPFQNLETSEKDKIMLKWFVDNEVAEQCVNSDDKLISEEEVECCPERINMVATETCVDSIEKYFEKDAWVAVLHVLESAKARSITCKVCNEELETRCVSCDLCLSWFHYHCAALSDTPRTKFWFCSNCSR